MKALTIVLCTLLVGGGAIQTTDARESKPATESGAIFASGPTDGGRLIIKRSPVLMYDMAVAVMIDGKPAGTIRRGHTYDRFITPGRHVLTASPKASAPAWRTTLDVRAGQTYTYLARYSINKLILDPVK